MVLAVLRSVYRFGTIMVLDVLRLVYLFFNGALLPQKGAYDDHGSAAQETSQPFASKMPLPDSSMDVSCFGRNTQSFSFIKDQKIRSRFRAKQQKHLLMDTKTKKNAKEEQSLPHQPTTRHHRTKLVKRITEKHIRHKASLSRMEAKEQEALIHKQHLEAAEKQKLLEMKKQVKQWSEGKSAAQMIMTLEPNLPHKDSTGGCSAYFAKWKTPSPGLSEKKLLKKFQLFAHPDKWAHQNLAPNEQELMKVLWDTIFIDTQETA